ncbi:MAG: DUF5107 domain-containing protein [Bacteroidaceae bacterium]|nr:DUF5107 domain-containing protein [Bacteroidaceae bacterium]
MVKAWKEDIVIPTYECGVYEKTPIFLENRVYQGSSGVVYPYPVIEKIADTKTDHTYHAVWIENEYIKVMILPELGGRVQMAYDKIRQRHFVYYNNVIKPALVGLAGPWISGGIEFNWPQHHRPSTFLPVDSCIEEHPDGSVTVWVNEQERMFHQKGLCGFTLRPGCAYLEIEGHLYNRTPLPQTFLWWANPAVHVNDEYRSVFPPDINAVFDHGKRAVSTFPIATGTYYKMDYSAGVDIANYKNIKVPTSYMAVNSKYNFEGGYENDTKGGMLHVASNHFSPGKKQWTWGNGDFGRAWDRNLTDDDGPYIELMAGVYTENQPDFTWLMPYEEKSFKQYFMPYHDLPDVKNASKDLVLNVERVDAAHIKVQVYATREMDVVLSCSAYEEVVHVSPASIFETLVPCEADRPLVQLLDASPNPRNGAVLLEYEPESDEIKRTPDAAEAALTPEDTKTNEQLYLTGLHLEQYRHATWSPVDYYEEALRRDPNDVRCNKQLGLWFLRRGVYDKALLYLQKATKILQKRNPNPYDGEPLYYMALCHYLMGETKEAYKWFWKASWNAAWAGASFMHCALISMNEGRYEDALDEINRSLSFGTFNHKAAAIKGVIECLLQNPKNADATMLAEVAADPFNFVCLYMQQCRQGADWERLSQLMHQSDCNYDDLALDLVEMGLEEEAVDVWKRSLQQGCASAMSLFHLSRYAGKEEAEKYYLMAETGSMGTFFPNRLEDIDTLLHHVRENQSARAAYLLGNIYYDKRQYDLAAEFWTLSAQRNPDFPIVWRNLALYAYNKCHDEGRVEVAVQNMERAFSLNEGDARLFMELDQLYKKVGQSADMRIAFYDNHPDVVEQRDDLLIERATLLNQLGRYSEAKALIDHHIFHPWEGGEGKVSTQYQLCRIEMAKQLMNLSDVDSVSPLQGANASDADLHEAITLLTESLSFPDNLGEGKLYGAQDNDIYYYLGLAYRLLADLHAGAEEGDVYAQQSRESLQKGTVGPTEPAAALYYNDAKPEKIYFAALCYSELGLHDSARALCYKLINYGKQHYYDEIKMDYFAVSLPDLLVWDEDLNVRNRLHCQKMIELGTSGLHYSSR